MADLVGSMKKAALEAVGATKPVAVFFGTVISASPLKIDVEQKMTLTIEQLVLVRNVTEHTIEMTVDHWTEDETEHTHSYFDSDTGLGASGSETRKTETTTHLHAYKGRKILTVHNGLIVGENVILLRVQGGQKFIVLDRVT